MNAPAETLITPKLGARRRNVSLASQELVKMEPLFAGNPRPLLIEATVPDFNLAAWASGQNPLLENLLLKHRALLFRNFAVRNTDEFQAAVRASSSGNFLEYVDRTTPRPAVGDKIYVSTVYPSQETIHMHNEGTYWTQWPLKIYFCCLRAAEQGGETPIADTQKVYERISPATREKFARKKIMYLRNYGDGFGLPWQETFQTKDRGVVENYCREHEIEFEWKSDDRLRTRQIRPAIRPNPRTGEMVWFNHGACFHITSLEPAVREALLKSFAEQDLPYNTYYGDGSTIENEVADELRAAYQAEKLIFPWKNGDVLLLDNMSMAHGRQPYTGQRQIVVAMVEAISSAEENL